MTINNDAQPLISKAREAMQNAYAPYSHFTVGAAVRFSDGRIFSGANIENASYGLTICAERVAVFKGVLEGAGRITAVALYVDVPSIPWPCGACRQVLAEFGDDFEVYLSNSEGLVKIMQFSELFPFAFKLNAPTEDSEAQSKGEGDR